jgi:hypothetical protein
MGVTVACTWESVTLPCFTAKTICSVSPLTLGAA